MGGIEAVRVELQYSRAGMALVAGWSLATAIVACVTPCSTGARMAMLAFIAALAVEAACRVALLRGPGAVRSFTMQRDGAIEVERPSGARLAGRVRAGSFVAPWLVILRWRREGARWDSTVLLLPDMAAAEDLRRLRVLLRWG
jgi:hypothetical protein